MQMHLLQLRDDGEFSLVKFPGNNVSRYAILSHTWGPESKEVTFQDIKNSAGKIKARFNKICFCGKQVKQDGLEYF